MPKHSFLPYIKKYITITDEEWELVYDRLSEETYKEGDILLAEDKVCRHLYFLESGLMRYYVTKDGEELNKFFTEPPYLFTSQQSFGLETPALETIEALQDSTVWALTKQQVDELSEYSFWRLFAEKVKLEVQGFTEIILEQIQGMTAEERYVWMLTNEQSLIRELPLKHLASYLGIAPQSLSRIRKKVAENRS
jgi:CRP-like cAMP-binding protein